MVLFDEVEEIHSPSEDSERQRDVPQGALAPRRARLQGARVRRRGSCPTKHLGATAAMTAAPLARLGWREYRR